MLVPAVSGAAVALDGAAHKLQPMRHDLLPMRGWNSWNWIGVSGCADKCVSDPYRCHNEENIRAMADALVESGLSAVGYDIINLSEGWMAECFRLGTCGDGRDATGTIMADPDRYPSGVAALSAYVRSKGLHFGVYFDAGNKTCARFPGSSNHEAHDVDVAVNQWNATYLWVDGCNMQGPADMATRYALWSRLLENTPAAWEVSWPAYVTNATDPAVSNTDLFFRAAALGQEFRFSYDNRPSFAKIMQIVNVTNYWQMQRFHGPGSVAFMDMLEAGNPPLTDVESRTHVALWVVHAQPLHLGHDVRNTSAALLSVLTNPGMLAIADDPLVAMGTRVNLTGSDPLHGHQAFSRELADASRAVVLLNADDSGPPTDVCVTLEALGLNPYKPTHVRNVWTHTDEGSGGALPNGTLCAPQVAAHDCVLLRVSQ